MDCAHTEFPDASFDVVHGSGILHHVGPDAGLREVRRLLAPGGVAIFLEPLQSGEVTERLKAVLSTLLPSWFEVKPVTSGEENLRLRDIEVAGRAWRECAVFPCRLTFRARKLFLPMRLWNRSARLDHWILSHWPAARCLAGAAVIVVRT